MLISTGVASWLQWLGIACFALILIAAWASSLHKVPAKKWRNQRTFFIVIFFIQLFLIIGHTIQLWIQYSNNDTLKYLLPPHSGFLYGIIARDVRAIFASWFSAGLFFLFTWFIFIRRGKGSLLDETDIYSLVLGSLIVGWPGILVFLIIIFVLSTVGMLILVAIGKKAITDRLVVTPFIFPSALVTLFIGPSVLVLTHLDKIRF